MSDYAQLADALIAQSQQLAEFEKRLETLFPEAGAGIGTGSGAGAGDNSRLQQLEAMLSAISEQVVILTQRMERLEEHVKLPLSWEERLQRIQASRASR